MVKIVVFDLDGTLVNSLTDLALSVNKGLLKAGLPEHPIGNYKTYVGNGRELLVKRAMGEASADAEKFDLVRSVFNEEYALHCNDNTAAYDGCAELLQKLADKKILTAVYSNKPDEFVGHLLKKIYPNHVFAEAWGKKPMYQPKPDGEALLKILALHNLTADDCLYVGDSDVDVFTAKNAGVRMAGVSWGFRGKDELTQAGAPFVADTAEDLYKYILDLS